MPVRLPSNGSVIPIGFRWTTFDLNSYLPGDWQQEIAAAAAEADFREFPRTPTLSRESPGVHHISRGRVHADQVRLSLPWLYKLYQGWFLELAREACAERVVSALDDRYGIVLNVQPDVPRFSPRFPRLLAAGLLIFRQGGQHQFAGLYADLLHLGQQVP